MDLVDTLRLDDVAQRKKKQQMKVTSPHIFLTLLLSYIFMTSPRSFNDTIRFPSPRHHHYVTLTFSCHFPDLPLAFSDISFVYPFHFIHIFLTSPCPNFFRKPWRLFKHNCLIIRSGQSQRLFYKHHCNRFIQAF